MLLLLLPRWRRAATTAAASGAAAARCSSGSSRSSRSPCLAAALTGLPQLQLIPRRRAALGMLTRAAAAAGAGGAARAGTSGAAPTGFRAAAAVRDRFEALCARRVHASDRPHPPPFRPNSRRPVPAAALPAAAAAAAAVAQRRGQPPSVKLKRGQRAWIGQWHCCPRSWICRGKRMQWRMDGGLEIDACHD